MRLPSFCRRRQTIALSYIWPFYTHRLRNKTIEFDDSKLCAGFDMDVYVGNGITATIQTFPSDAIFDHDYTRGCKHPFVTIGELRNVE